MSVPLSVLDVAPITAGSSASEALRRTTDLARLADRLGYARYWFAEHHSMPTIASSAPEVLIAHVAAATERVRVGSGGIMLPNHVPLKIAEVFHTLEALHPGRIDFGIGRAGGTDPTTLRALRSFDAEQFPAQMAEMLAFSRGELPDDHPFRFVRVVPNDVDLPPIWILGSSGASARYAGQLGVGYGFASHFSASPAAPAFEAYRAAFEPSDDFPEPHTILAVSAVVAETDAEADRLATSMDLAWVHLRRGDFQPIQRPEDAMAYDYSPQDRAVVAHYRALQTIGSPETVRAQIEAKVEASGADEVMVMTNVYDPAARLRSYELLAEAFELEADPLLSSRPSGVLEKLSP
jgi:luciferase family oxidoreductase group 1